MYLLIYHNITQKKILDKLQKFRKFSTLSSHLIPYDLF
jgi:hypothetical protein